MKKLVTISREYGSGGREIAKLLAEKLDVPFYDRDTIDAALIEEGYSKEFIRGAEQKAKSGFAYSLAGALGFNDSGNLSINDKLFLAHFEVIKKIAETGEGVIVGRCADYVLKDMPGVTNVFLYAEMEDSVRRAQNKYGVEGDYEAVEKHVIQYNKARANYYNYHTGLHWGDVKNYNLALNTSYISYEEAATLIANYVESREYKEEL